MDLIKSLEYNKIQNIDLKCFNFNDEEFLGPIGKEHYKLLAYLSTLFNDTYFIDIGTNYGNSALALSYNNTNKI